jgi:2-keto-4-pentenoate hydratase/2-oxohepta-3-ene-1,7-dioic acid hydratase in catechol pathway
MRLARYEADGRIVAGVVVDGEQVAPLADASPSLLPLLADVPTARRAAEAALRRTAELRSLDEVRLLAPLPSPRKYLAIGFNSPDHAAETTKGPMTTRRKARMETNAHIRAAFPNPRFPQLFNKQTSCITGPFDSIWAPADATTLDYEGEVAVVIGRRLRRASEPEARDAIAGYLVANDVSVREWQFETTQIWLGKSFETHGPTGPWISTADEVDEDALRIRTWVNGELRQDGRFADQTLSAAAIVATLSQLCTLEPGDLVATGTPAGVGAATERFLGVGDIVRVEVAGLGHIENRVIPEPR